MRVPALTVRTRLTLLLSCLFLALGAALLTLNYTLVAKRLPVRIAYDEAPASASSTPPDDLVIVADGTAVGPAEAGVLPDVLDNLERGRQRTLDELVRQSLIAMAIATAASVGLAWIAAGRLLRPIHRITATARRINDGNLDERIGLGGPNDELRELADTFDDMLARLEGAVAAERRLIANAAHQLRTPLANQRTLLEVGLIDPAATADELRTMAAASLQQVERSQRLIDALLRLARTTNHPLSPVDMDLATVSADVIAMVDQGDRRLTHELQPSLINADPVLIEQAISNLVENAIRHNQPGGYVRVVTGGGKFTIVNSGPHILSADVDVLFEPFRRSHNRTGSHQGLGLGLALVNDIVKAHRGRIAATPGPDGGLDITIDLTESVEPGLHVDGTDGPTDPLAGASDPGRTPASDSGR